MPDAVTITTSDGESLQAEATLAASPRAAVLITHPNPLMGGDMYTPVPAGLFGALGGLGVSGMRFNFRGVGRSTGSHDKGGAEQLDVAAAVEHLAELVPGVPLVLAGWSFGADLILTSADERVAGWFLAAAPLRVVAPETMVARTSPRPKLFAVPAEDQFAPPDVIEATVADWVNTSITVIERADHFFGAQLPVLVERFEAFVEDLL